MADDRINFGTERNRERYEALPPEGKAAIARMRAANRAPEALAEEQRIRELAEQDFPPAQKTDPVDETLLTLVATLRTERERQGLSLADVVRLSGVNLSTISRLELGKIPNPTYGTLRAYAEALGLGLEITTTRIP